LFASQSWRSLGKTWRCKSVALVLHIFKGRAEKYPECACCGWHWAYSKEFTAPAHEPATGKRRSRVEEKMEVIALTFESKEVCIYSAGMDSRMPWIWETSCW
jgi:hypothetical protein